MRLLRRLLILVLTLPLAGAAVGTANAQARNGITSPRDNAEVGGVVLIEGTATTSDFLRYELAFFKEFDPLGDWVVFATEEQPVVGGVLASWDTTVGRDMGAPFYPDGTYRLRLRVVRQDANYDEFYVMGLSLVNEEATPTPTDTPEPEGVASAVPTSVLLLPTELPTLTPFPSATPRPKVVAEQEAAAGEEAAPGRGLSLEGEVSVEQIRGGALLGVKISLGFFALLASYLIGRRLVRTLLARARSLLSR